MGVGYLCSPVSGNAKVAKAGKLLQVASGPKALYEEVEPFLQAMARRVMWVGEGELARVWKIAHNTMFGVIIQNLCEITVMAEKAGIPRHIFPGKHQRLGAGLHVHQVQNAHADQPYF